MLNNLPIKNLLCGVYLCFNDLVKLGVLLVFFMYHLFPFLIREKVDFDFDVSSVKKDGRTGLYTWSCGTHVNARDNKLFFVTRAFLFQP